MLIAIVGVDGSGKSTQAKLLVSRLRKYGLKCSYLNPVYFLHSLCNPLRSRDPLISPRKTKVLRSTVPRRDDASSLLMIFLGYLYSFLSFLYVFMTSKRGIVVCDRFFFQFFYDLCEQEAENLIRLFPKPDVVFYLFGDLDTFYSRMSDPYDATVHRSYYLNFMQLLDRLSDRYGFIRVDASLTTEEVSNIIADKVEKSIRRD